MKLSGKNLVPKGRSSKKTFFLNTQGIVYKSNRIYKSKRIKLSFKIWKLSTR